MKKVNFKNALMALVVALTFLFLGTEHANAQSNASFNPSAGVPGVTYMSSSDAQATLLAAMMDLKPTLEGMVPGSAVYNATLRQVYYYHGIYTELQAGKSVPMSIENGLTYLNDSNGFGNLSKSQKMTLRQEAESLLGN